MQIHTYVDTSINHKTYMHTSTHTHLHALVRSTHRKHVLIHNVRPSVSRNDQKQGKKGAREGVEIDARVRESVAEYANSDNYKDNDSDQNENDQVQHLCVMCVCVCVCWINIYICVYVYVYAYMYPF
jgi:hypothetical protein